MGYFFTDLLRAQLNIDQTILNGATLGVVLYYAAPDFENNAPRYTGIETADELAAQFGWQEAAIPGYPIDNDRTVGTRIQGNSTYLMLSDFPLDDDLEPVLVRAIGFYYKGVLGGITDPLLLVTNTPVGGGLILTGGDRISPKPDTTLGGANNRWLLGWATANPGGSLVEGPLAVQKNAPEFEPSHVQHVWLYPQRVNVIANPSFEAGVTHWRTNGSLAQVDAPDLPEVGTWAGRFTGTTPLIVESNKFLGLTTEWTIRFLAAGTGEMRVGLMSWVEEYDETACDWGGDESWILPGPGAFIEVQALRGSAEMYEGQVRIEVDGTELTLDRVICEPGYLLDWGYFDGDTTYSARDDYSWYGGENLKGRTYSLFYNNRRAIAGRLFATSFTDRAAATSVAELSEGLVYQWVPAGTLVEPHWDVLFEGDLQHPVADVAGTPITPYRVALPGTPEYTADMGVENPWNPEEPVGP
jgi:hypothetical protein